MCRTLVVAARRGQGRLTYEISHLVNLKKSEGKILRKTSSLVTHRETYVFGCETKKVSLETRPEMGLSLASRFAIPSLGPSKNQYSKFSVHEHVSKNSYLFCVNQKNNIMSNSNSNLFTCKNHAEGET